MDPLAPSYADQTLLHPVATAAAFLAAVAVLLAPRRYVVPVLFGFAICVTPAQRVSVAGVDFTLLRLLLMVGLARILIFEDLRRFTMKPVDWGVAVVAAVMLVVPVFNGAKGSTGAVLVQQLGLVGFDALLLYGVLRMMLRDRAELSFLVSAMAAVALPVAAMFQVEAFTGRNPFSVFGGVPEWTEIREGRLRCQGAFVHPIIAGCFFAGVFPLVLMWPAGTARRVLHLAGAAACLAIVYASASSTPVGGVGVALLAVPLFYARSWLRPARWAALGALIVVHFVRPQPVWHLLASVQFVGGSTGWHRYRLIDAWVRNAREWLIVGTGSTAHWGRGLVDVTCQYISYSLNAGLLGLLALLGLIVTAYHQTGSTLRRVAGNGPASWAVYAAGTALTVHVVCFVGVSYFGQGTFIWYLTLAFVAVAGVGEASNEPNEPDAYGGRLPASAVDEAEQAIADGADPLSPRAQGVPA